MNVNVGGLIILRELLSSLITISYIEREENQVIQNFKDIYIKNGKLLYRIHISF